MKKHHPGKRKSVHYRRRIKGIDRFRIGNIPTPPKAVPDLPIMSMLAPHIRAAGLRETARRCIAIGIAGVTDSALSDWMRSKPGHKDTTRPRDFKSRQIDAICRVLGLTITISKESVVQ